ncbi:hypothetical protein [Methylobacterium sp. E-065]|uniref:hypothetical protein n=1 Tax=Methylobacterium sp. E-065 TaxID=2836583 RepID=UPI0028BDEAB8|nr:hypothetical protein [Methylobacterium sp. E-065]
MGQRVAAREQCVLGRVQARTGRREALQRRPHASRIVAGPRVKRAPLVGLGDRTARLGEFLDRLPRLLDPGDPLRLRREPLKAGLADQTFGEAGELDGAPHPRFELDSLIVLFVDEPLLVNHICICAGHKRHNYTKTSIKT